jgi:hypothetical protein
MPADKAAGAGHQNLLLAHNVLVFSGVSSIPTLYAARARAPAGFARWEMRACCSPEVGRGARLVDLRPEVSADRDATEF